ncbi:fetuin B [Aplochiton taeniatus]
MRQCVFLLLVSVCVSCAPTEKSGVQPGACQDAVAASAAEQALSKINNDRKDGYIFSLRRLANVNMDAHGETGMVFYLTMDVVETSCPVLSRKEWKSCTPRDTYQTPVYGQCKATIYMNRVHRVVRLYNYNCVIRPAPAARVGAICPDCPSYIAKDNAEILKTAEQSLQKFNKENGLANHFALVNITRATSSGGMVVFYNVEYTVQETSCATTSDPTQADKCPLMECEFAHKGHCKGTHSHTPDGEQISVECEIYEPEASESEKKLHLLGGETDHSHTHADGHSHTHADGHSHTHDHGHDVTHTHVHDHTKDHVHDHVHSHHATAHDHSADSGPSQHHDYKHAAGAVHTHDHDHELALDHAHVHVHLHEHEHHHHHHDHAHGHGSPAHPGHPRGHVTVLPALDQPMTLPSFPDQPAAGPAEGVALPLSPDPDIPGEREPSILPFPASVSPQCPAPVTQETAGGLVMQLFAEDPMFKTAA